jgi:hypothetical protein
VGETPREDVLHGGEAPNQVELLEDERDALPRRP